MGYSYYCPHLALGFVDVELNGAQLVYDDGKEVQVFATEINKGYICQAFIGIECKLDINGKPYYKQKAYEELEEFILLYKAFHNIREEIKLNFRPVISGDLEYKYSYEIE